MAVRSNLPKSRASVTTTTATAPVVNGPSLVEETVAALFVALPGGKDNNKREAARCLARAVFNGVDIAEVQKRWFDAGGVGALFQQVRALSRDYTRESLALADKAAASLQAAATATAKDRAREARRKAAEAPLTVPLLAAPIRLG